MKSKIKKGGKINWEEFRIKLSNLLQDYELKDCIFAGENNEGKMIGVFSAENAEGVYTQKGIVNSSFNAARLYQSSRERIMSTIDQVKV
jgi:hypothetical protein